MNQNYLFSFRFRLDNEIHKKGISFLYSKEK